MLKQVREYFGLTQEEMGTFMQISRSYYSMAELNLREVDMRKKIGFWALHKFMTAKPGKGKPTPEMLTEFKKQKDKKESFIEQSIRKKERTLQNTKESLRNAEMLFTNSLNILTRFEKIESIIIFRGQKHVVKIIKSVAERRLAVNGTDARFKMELRIRSLDAEIAFLKKHMK